MIEIALYQPDIAPNAATMIRLAACFGLKLTIIEPAGFISSDSSFRRAGLDYLDRANLTFASSWEAFCETQKNRRLILITTKTEQKYCDFSFSLNDTLVMGRESSGVPESVHAQAAARLKIPLRTGERSLNVSLACAIVTAEALRQLGGFQSLT